MFSNFYLFNLSFPIFHRNENFQRSHSHSDNQRMNMGYQFKNISGMNKMKYKIGVLGSMPLFNFNFIKDNKQLFILPSAELFFSVSLGRN